AFRLKAMGNRRYVNGFEVTLHWDKINDPLSWKKPRLVFVNSMSDLFHPDVPGGFIDDVVDVMGRASRHTFQVLTKRPQRAMRHRNWQPLPVNVSIGTSIATDRYVFRADDLRKIDAHIRFLSLAPLLGPLPSLDLTGIGWVIVGGESGPKHRPIEPDWVRDLRDMTTSAGVPFFFKQWGGHTPKAGGRQLDGRTWNQMPTEARSL